MTADRLLQKLKRHEGKTFRERNSPELTKEFSRRLVACLNEKENELEKERRHDRPQEEGDLIDRRIKEKERLKREKDAAESSGRRSDRSDRHDKSEGERREKKRKDGGDPMKVDSDSDTAEREIYNKAAVKKKDLKEKEEEVVTEKKGLLESIMNKFS